MEAKRNAAGSAEKPRPAFFYRLSARAQRTYLKSESIDRLPLTTTPAAVRLAGDLIAVLESGTLGAVNEAARALIAELCRSLRVPNLRLEVRDVRPHNARGELHGILFPTRPPLIVLWMRTARRHDVVKPKTFVRTLLHELGHYLDYVLLRLEDSFHTSGFFKRESFLVRAVYPAEPPPAK